MLKHDIFYYRAPEPSTYYAELGYAEGILMWKDALEEVIANNPNYDWDSLSKDDNDRVRSAMFYHSSSIVGWVGGAHYPYWTLSNGIKMKSVYGSYLMRNGEPSLFIPIHESAHGIFNFPDTYDTDYDSGGTGAYTVMSGGKTSITEPIGAPFRAELGWGNIIEPVAGTQTITLKADGDDIVVYKNPLDDKEYFSIEARKQSNFGNDRFTAELGLLVWHSDLNVTTSNRKQDMTAENHYKHSIVQADGLFELEKNTATQTNKGNEGDIYIPGRTFTDTTVPNSKWWNDSSSNFEIKNIEFIGDDSIRFDIVLPDDSEKGTNLALSGSASQSSNYSTTLGLAQLAIDGNTNGAWSGNSVTHTTVEDLAWWQVRLEKEYALGEIKIWNRTDDCCSTRLINFDVFVYNDAGTLVYKTTIEDSPNTSVIIDAEGVVGSRVRVKLKGSEPLSLAEVQVYEDPESGNFIPDPNTTYYIDSPIHNLRLAATGESEDAYTTDITTTGSNVEWKFVDKENGSWHIELASGGSKPRLRTDGSAYADMQETTSNGIYTYYDITEGYSENTYFITLPDGPDNYKRLQVNNLEEVKMVSMEGVRNWESFRITEVESVVTNIHLEAEDYNAMSGIQTEVSSESGENVGWINNGDWLRFDDVNLSGMSNIDVRVATQNTGGTIEIRTSSVTGTLIGSINVSNTGDFQAWTTLNTNVNNIIGIQDVYLVFTGETGYLFNVNWIEFNTNSQSSKDVLVVSEVIGVNIYPNPVTETTTIENAINSIINVYDTQGKVVFTKLISRNTDVIDLSALQTGIYYAEVKKESSNSIIKMVKN